MTTVSGLERSCQECGEPVMVERVQAGHFHVFHTACIARIVKRNAWRALARQEAEEREAEVGR